MKGASILILGALAGTGLVAQNLDQYTDIPTKAVGLDAHETNAGASVLGQFRTSATSWLWMRTDLYLHNGVEMRVLSEAEKRAGRQGVGSTDAELGAILNDDNIVTVVPQKERDFRGIFGDIERATQTYQSMEMHAHNTPKDTLPLFRLMTWIDPQFVPGWTTAATVMAEDRTEATFTQAIALLQEGLQNNPESIVILNELGRMHAGRKRDFKSAITYLSKGIDLERDVRRMDEDEIEAYVNAFRWLALCYRETEQPDKQRTIAARGLEIFPEDRVLARLIGEPPYILSEQGQQEWLEKEIAIHGDENGHDHEIHDHHHDH